MATKAVLSSEIFTSKPEASAARRRALGALASGVVHEINNPLSCIYSNLEQIKAFYRVIEPVLTEFRKNTSTNRGTGSLMAKRYAQVHEFAGDFSEVVEDSLFACERIENVVRDLHAYATLYNEPFGLLSINELVETVLQRLTDERPNLSILSINLATKMPLIFTERSTVEAVIYRLIDRAFKAVDCSLNPSIDISTYHKSGTVYLKVSDNGLGFPHEYLGAVFDPFFSDPSCAANNNLSLSLGRIAIEELGGAITSQGEYGEGSQFILSFSGEPA